MSTSIEHSGPRTKIRRGRGKARKSLELIAKMYELAERLHPITPRGIAYKLFALTLIASMEDKDTRRVSRLLKDAREDGTIPWEWIVDETRELERASSWRDGDEFIEVVRRSYRRDFWLEQPRRVEVWSEKGTVRGVLAPVLHDYGVGFRVMHGFTSATSVHEVAQTPNDVPLVALYVGDHDCSGMYMSEADLPNRLDRYDGDHVELYRIALVNQDLEGLPSFSAHTKKKDPRYRWYVERFGDRCWELDAMDENDLRSRVEQSIVALIEPEAWARCERAQEAEQESLEALLDKWPGDRGGK